MSNSVSLYSLAQKLPLVRGFTHEVSPYFAGSVIENRLGLQVFRTVGKHLSRELRSNQATEQIARYVDTIKRDGVLAIPEFLAPAQFAEVLKEVEGLQDRLSFKPFRGTVEGKLSIASIELNGNPEKFPAIHQHLQKNPLILALASAVIKRKQKSLPPVTINIYKCDDPNAPDNDIENVLHADLHAPTVKAFFYVNDIDESNGAFVYAKGSHRFSINRLRHEYDLSIRAAKLKKNGSSFPSELVAVRGTSRRPTISPRFRQLMQIQETAICGKANTLVMTNNMGFHRRGEFKGKTSRKTILINFRHLEHCF